MIISGKDPPPGDTLIFDVELLEIKGHKERQDPDQGNVFTAMDTNEDNHLTPDEVRGPIFYQKMDD